MWTRFEVREKFQPKKWFLTSSSGEVFSLCAEWLQILYDKLNIFFNFFSFQKKMG
jgi:hypothetical protein